MAMFEERMCRILNLQFTSRAEITINFMIEISVPNT